MKAHKLVSILLGEATVRLPPRGRRYIGIFTGPEPGQQIAHSTGLMDRRAALALVRRWEADALRQRKARWKAGRASPSPPGRLPGLTQAEVATVMGLSQRAVRSIEQRAIRKLRNHPLLRQLWAEFESAPASASVQESLDLTGEELVALFGLAETSQERRALRKVLAALRGIGERPPPNPR
jgi:transcriptional regulator with XRE-family HTH domain